MVWPCYSESKCTGPIWDVLEAGALTAVGHRNLVKTDITRAAFPTWAIALEWVQVVSHVPHRTQLKNGLKEVETSWNISKPTQVARRARIAPAKIGPLRFCAGTAGHVIVVPERVAQDLPGRVQLEVDESGGKCAINNRLGIRKLAVRSGHHQQVAPCACQQILGSNARKKNEKDLNTIRKNNGEVLESRDTKDQRWELR